MFPKPTDPKIYDEYRYYIQNEDSMDDAMQSSRSDAELTYEEQAVANDIKT